MRYLLQILFITILCLSTCSTVFADVSLLETATQMARALAGNDTAAIEKHLLTYEDGCQISDKIKQQSSADYIKGRDKIVYELLRELKAAKADMDAIEIQDAIIVDLFSSTGKQGVIVSVRPVITQYNRKIPYHRLELMFIQVGKQWKYQHST